MCEFPFTEYEMIYSRVINIYKSLCDINVKIEITKAILLQLTRRIVWL